MSLSQKEVKIIGISVKENFGALKATELTFDENNRLTVIKGEVGAGKSTLNKAMRLTVQGSSVLTDKSLYGDDVHLETQLSDGDKKIFVGCRSGKDGALGYYIYMIDENGNKVNDVVIDGVKATPANYLKNMQTALTWRLDELTSENPVTQRNILLELYSSELEAKGVVFDKNNPKYVGGIIDQIEKAKNDRNHKDMKRKEVGGIADDMQKKGIDFSERIVLKSNVEAISNIAKKEAAIALKKENPASARENDLTAIKLKGSEANTKLRQKNDEIKKQNLETKEIISTYNSDVLDQKDSINNIERDIINLCETGNPEENIKILDEVLAVVNKYRIVIPEPTEKLIPELQFNEKGTCTSKSINFEGYDFAPILKEYEDIILKYVTASNKPLEVVDTSLMDEELKVLRSNLKNIDLHNETAKSVNSYKDWQDSNAEVIGLNKDYFMKLTEINTGVEGLFICPEFIVNDKDEKVAKGNDIYLMYNGTFDTKYFNNEKKELRKLSAYSDTQKPMICLLIQKYLLSKKSKILPYLWIDQVPIDKKTKALLDRMSDELGLWLFVNWTGDFDKTELKDNEILVENGEVFFNKK